MTVRRLDPVHDRVQLTGDELRVIAELERGLTTAAEPHDDETESRRSFVWRLFRRHRR